METVISTTVEDVMSKDIISVDSAESVTKVIALMVEHDIGSVLVKERGNLVGILTHRDIMKHVCPGELCTKKTQVKALMSSPLVTIDAKAKLGTGLQKMNEKNIRRLVVTDGGKIVGIVTQKDVLKGTLETFSALASLAML